jgi:hypothetical protein
LSAVVCGFCERQHNILGELAIERNHEDSCWYLFFREGGQHSPGEWIRASVKSRVAN